MCNALEIVNSCYGQAVAVMGEGRDRIVVKGKRTDWKVREEKPPLGPSEMPLLNVVQKRNEDEKMRMGMGRGW